MAAEIPGQETAQQWLFVKELVERGSVILEKVPTKLNKADFLTKAVPAATLQANLELLPSLVRHEIAESHSREPGQSAEVHSLEVETESCVSVVQTTTLEQARPSDTQCDSCYSGPFCLTLLISGAVILMGLGFWILQKWCRKWCLWLCGWRRLVRSVQTQSQVTYTATQQEVRKRGAQPRFQPLPEAQHGAWVQ